jgi:hypothetical protein
MVQIVPLFSDGRTSNSIREGCVRTLAFAVYTIPEINRSEKKANMEPPNTTGIFWVFKSEDFFPPYATKTYDFERKLVSGFIPFVTP